jgi:hypothetical protein
VDAFKASGPKGARLDRRGAHFPMRTPLPLNEPHLHPMADELVTANNPEGPVSATIQRLKRACSGRSTTRDFGFARIFKID